MININYIKRTFVRQSALSDCGTACLAMIFNYVGKTAEVPLMLNLPIGVEGLSLADLRAISAKYGLNGRCVRMDSSYLRKLEVPCILHMTTEHGKKHFQVCYGCRKRGDSFQYLMGDPSKQVYLLDEKELQAKWESGGALFFENISADPYQFRKPTWLLLWSFRYCPNGILVVVPIITISIGILGLSLTWMLQKGINDDSIYKGHISFCLLFLLFAINIFKSTLTLLKQYIMIQTNTRIHKHLFGLLLNKLFHKSSCEDLTLNDIKVKNGLADIKKMESALSNFIATLLSDGALVLLFVSAGFFYLPLAGVINLCYISITIYMIFKYLPVATYDTAHLNSLAGAAEKFIIADIMRLRDMKNLDTFDGQKKIHVKNQQLQISHGTSSVLKGNKLLLRIEALGTLNVFSVFALALYQFSAGEMSATALMITVILSYLLVSFMPKVCNGLLVIAEGADAAVQFSELIR
jgi:ABC-type bacteriocin/lantibiotic exporter with double-glycine peptidase domain